MSASQICHHIRTVCFPFLCLFLLPATGLAQEEEKPEGIFESREQYNEFMGELREIDNPELKQLIPVLNDVIMASHGLKKESFGTPFRNENAWMTRLLENEKVRNDIDMLDYQFEDLQNAGRAIQRRMESQIRAALRQHSDGGVDAEQLMEQLNAIRNQAEGEMDATMLPHQQERLKQILLQARLGRESPVNMLGSGALAEQLGIDQQQKQQLEEEWKQIQRRLQDDIARLREEARQELVDKLEPEQRNKFNEIFGESFSFRSNTGRESEQREEGARERRRERGDR